MIRDTLSQWIAESESWQTFIDFDLPEESIERYPFLRRPDDFYISLFGELYEILDNLEERKMDVLPIAKGLEIFSLKTKREKFDGVDYSNNILFAAGLYYLADYSASGYILANLYSEQSFVRDIDKFLLSFLQRRFVKGNRYSFLLQKYLLSGNDRYIDNLLKLIQDEKIKAYYSNPGLFSIFFLSESVVKKFKVNNVWSDLLLYNSINHWRPFVEKIIRRKFPVWDFFPSQRMVLGKGALTSFETISLQTPTSSGKTAICELLIYNEYKQNNKAKFLYLAPFRALASELRESFGRNLSRLGIRSKTIYGGNIPTVTEKALIENVTLLISTPEKFIALENSIPDFLDDFTTIICDEGHLLDDGNRGLSYELLLSRLKSQKEIERKFIFISAIIPNIDKINTWLGGTNNSIIQSTYRATEIEYAFLTPLSTDIKTFYLDVNPLSNIPKNYKLNRFITEEDFQFQAIVRRNVKVKEHPINPKSLSTVSALKALNSGTVALFNPIKGGNAGVIAHAEQVMEFVGLNPNLPHPLNFVSSVSTVVNKLVEYFSIIFGENYSLVRFVQNGGLYHHGDLPQYVREVIEDAIRNEHIKLIICTNTLAEGVNLPIKTIVVYSTSRFNEETSRPKPLDKRELKNLFGRAGRAGKETKGLIIIANPKDFPIVRHVIRNEEIEDVSGYLYEVVQSISKTITRRRLVLTNDILESQDEEFKTLIDAIDLSIIDLLSEEIQPEDLEESVRNLINETFAKFQANDAEIITLNTLLNLRAERIKPLIENKEFRFVKQSGSSIRLYSEIVPVLDLDNPLWSNLEDPISDDWLTFLIEEVIGSLLSFQYKLSEFNRVNKTSLVIADVKAIVKEWISGAWFEELSKVSDSSIDTTLRLMNSLVGYQVQSLAATVIRNVEMRFDENELTLSEVVLDFSQYLQYGLNSKLQLALVEAGFNDRIGIIDLANFLNQEDFVYDDIFQLKRYLRQNRSRIVNDLKGKSSEISYEKICQGFENLRYRLN